MWTLARLHVSESFTDSVLTGDMRNSHCHSWHLGICLRAVSFFSHIFGAISFVQIFSCMNGQAGIAFIFGFNKVWFRLCPWGYGGIIVGQPAAAAGVGKGGKKNRWHVLWKGMCQEGNHNKLLCINKYSHEHYYCCLENMARNCRNSGNVCPESH